MATNSSGPDNSPLPNVEYPRHIAVYRSAVRGWNVGVMRWDKTQERYEPEREYSGLASAQAEEKADRLADALGLEVRKL